MRSTMISIMRSIALRRVRTFSVTSMQAILQDNDGLDAEQ